MSAAIRDGQFALLANGTRLHYAAAGEPGKPLMLFVHGFPEFWREWQDILPAFGEDYFAVAPDLRGFNLSDQPADVAAYRPKHIVDDLRLLIGHLGYERAVIVAHDWGGAVCWNLAIALPQLVERLIIVNSPHPYIFARALATDPAQQQSSAYMNWLRQEGSEEALAANDFEKLEGFFWGMGQPPAPWFAGALRAQYHEAWSRGLRGGVNYYRASPLHPPKPGDPDAAKLALNPDDFRVKVPTRVIWGENDMALPKSLLTGLEEVVDDLKVERIPEGTHWVVHEQPARIAGLIRRFLTE